MAELRSKTSLHLRFQENFRIDTTRQRSWSFVVPRFNIYIAVCVCLKAMPKYNVNVVSITV